MWRERSQLISGHVELSRSTEGSSGSSPAAAHLNKMPRVRNKYCDIIESIIGDIAPDCPYDSLDYRVQVAQAIFFCHALEYNWDYIRIGQEIDVYPVVVWEIVENWIRYDILGPDGVIYLEEKSFEDALHALVEITQICLCGAGALERKEKELIDEPIAVWLCSYCKWESESDARPDGNLCPACKSNIFLVNTIPNKQDDQ